MKQKAIALENIRSIYNVWNIIRTADALDFDVILLWFTPWLEDSKLSKTALWAEKSVNIKKYYNVKKGLEYIKGNYKKIIWAELTNTAIPIENINKKLTTPVCIVVWNEVNWISLETLENLDYVSFIPMHGIKKSINVCEASSIFMYELSKL